MKERYKMKNLKVRKDELAFDNGVSGEELNKQYPMQYIFKLFLILEYILFYFTLLIQYKYILSRRYEQCWY